MTTLSNVNTRRGDSNPLSVSFASDAFPEARSSKTGVSVDYASASDKQWYVFRASYGREDKAADYLIEDGTYTYIAKKYVERYLRGKRKRYLQTLIPNLLFAYTTQKKDHKHLLFVQPSQCHYKRGEMVKVVEGPFRGVEGRVARISGQQRVVVNLTQIGLISTAYIPTAFIHNIDDNKSIY